MLIQFFCISRLRLGCVLIFFKDIYLRTRLARKSNIGMELFFKLNELRSILKLCWMQIWSPVLVGGGKKGPSTEAVGNIVTLVNFVFGIDNKCQMSPIWKETRINIQHNLRIDLNIKTIAIFFCTVFSKWGWRKYLFCLSVDFF